jgi:hypothetical protein
MENAYVLEAGARIFKNSWGSPGNFTEPLVPVYFYLPEFAVVAYIIWQKS